MPYVLYGTYSTFSLRLPFQKRCLCQHLDTDKSTHSLSSGVDVVGGFHIVKTLVLCKLGTEPVCRHGFSHIVLAPQLVGFVQSLGACFAVSLEADISLRLQKLNDIVAAALDRFHVLNGLSADGELLIVCKQSVQSLQTPQKDTLHLGHELFHEKRIVGTVSRSVLGGKHNLTAKETVRLVMQGGYAHHFIGNALLDCRRQEEAGSFKSLDEYKAARGIAWLYNNSGKSAKEVIAEYAAEQNCTEETAAEYLTLARQNRRRVPFYSTMQDEDSEETGEDVTCDDSWNYADILWNGIRAKEVQAAFDKLSYKEQDFLERRNAICMNCGRVMPWDERTSFEKLSTDYEYSSTSGAERFYKRVVEKMTGLLLDAGVLGVVELKLTDKNKKIAAAAYEYKAVHRYANDDDEWGEIRFDFSVRTAQIVKLADGDLSRSNVFAKIAIRQILTLSVSELPKKLTIPFELEMERIRYGS